MSPRIHDFGSLARNIFEGGNAYLGTKLQLDRQRDEDERRDRQERVQAERQAREDALALQQAQDASRLSQSRAGYYDAQAETERAGAHLQGRIAGSGVDPNRAAMDFARQSLSPEDYRLVENLPDGPTRNRIMQALNERAQQAQDEADKQDLVGEIQRGTVGDAKNPPLYSPQIAQQLVQGLSTGGTTLAEVKRHHQAAKMDLAKRQASMASAQQNMTYAQARLADPEVLAGLDASAGMEQAIQLLSEYQIEARLNPDKVNHQKFRTEFELLTSGPGVQDAFRDVVGRADAAEAALFALGVSPQDLQAIHSGEKSLTGPPTGAPTRAGLARPAEPGALFQGGAGAGGAGGSAGAAPQPYESLPKEAQTLVDKDLIELIDNLPDSTSDDALRAAVKAVLDHHGVTGAFEDIFDKVIPKARQATKKPASNLNQRTSIHVSPL